MKKIILMAFVALSTLTIGCSNDDAPQETVNNNPLVGKWVSVNSTQCGPDMILTFQTNNNLIQDENGLDNNECVSSNDSFTYKYENNKLITNNDGYNDTTDVVIDGNKLIIEDHYDNQYEYIKE